VKKINNSSFLKQFIFGKTNQFAISKNFENISQPQKETEKCRTTSEHG